MNACESVRQNGRRVDLCAQGYSALQGWGGSLKGEESKGSSVRRLGAAPPIFQKGGKLEGTELQAADEGSPVRCRQCTLWSPAEQVIQQKPTC